jgi:type III pantothenate kinase
MTGRALLCVADVGNTHTVVGVYDGETLVGTWRLRTDRDRTTDEWGLNLGTLFGMQGLDMGSITGMAISSVVPPALHTLRRASQRYFHTEALVVGPGVKTGLPIRNDNPREVGADRVVNAVAAFARLKRACIVVDFGTATTFDCISQKGEYMGGAIAPGLQISLEALVSRAAKLQRVEIGTPERAIGRNTEEAMQSGILFGYAALTDGLVRRLAAEMGGEVAVIATGGLAGTVSVHATTIQSVEPNLTLEGLRLIYLRNR